MELSEMQTGLGVAVSDERSANAVDKRIGERVRARRLAISMSQERLAELVGITFQQVQKYEKGVNRIAASRLLEICNALEIPVASLFDGIGARRSGSSASAPGLDAALATPGALELVTLFAELKTPALRRQVLELVRTIHGG